MLLGSHFRLETIRTFGSLSHFPSTQSQVENPTNQDREVALRSGILRYWSLELGEYSLKCYSVCRFASCLALPDEIQSLSIAPRAQLMVLRSLLRVATRSVSALARFSAQLIQCIRGKENWTRYQGATGTTSAPDRP
jgi:hypothetical protein